MEDRTRRILETAIALAERDGYDAVRLRDVAAQAEVALGTVYRRFASKEDILVGALQLELERMGQFIQENPIQGDEPVSRTAATFRVLTRALVQKPNLARAILRAVASGVPESAGRVGAFRAHTSDLVVAMLFDLPAPEEHKRQVATFLLDIWFAKLVGWSGGLMSLETVYADLAEACRLLLR
jgi:AcrR family transcriptional regulator